MKRATRHTPTFSRARKRRNSVIFAFLFALSVTFYLSNVPAIVSVVHRASVEPDVSHNPPIFKQQNTYNQQRHCVVHIHGLHHSGTGFTRQVVYDSLGGNATASKHTNTRVTQDEGQHLQKVYPNFRKRLQNPQLCGVPSRQELPTSFDKLYTCPQLVEMFETNLTIAQQRLHNQWSRHWDTSKFYLIQKTPTLDLGLLEKLALYPTIHVVVMRHPFGWKRVILMLNSHLSQTLGKDPLLLPKTWWNVWVQTLESLSSHEINSFVVVNYEELLQDKTQVSKELSKYIRDECHADATDDSVKRQQEGQQTNTRRRLHLYTNTTDSLQYLVSETAIESYKQCLGDNACNQFMKASADVLEEFGYHWNPEVQFQLPLVDSKLLFTSDKPPSMELVQRMKQVVAG